ncbi:MAG: phage portal protein, partial [Armatimonadia bacterium]
EHGFGYCPVVRFLNRYDLDGHVVGEVQPLIPLQDQINFTTFGLLMAQQYAAFRQRWVTGMAIPEDDKGQAIEPLNVAVNRLLVAEDPDTKFGEFGQTDLGGYIESRESTLRHLATISQVPPHNLLGQMANLSAEALAAAEAGQSRKISERKASFGESWEQVLRMAAAFAGDVESANDMSAQVVWRDTEARSLSSTVDALGKLAQMLGVPPQELWDQIPGVSAQDVERWRATAAEGDSLGQFAAMLDRQTQALLPEPPMG